MSAWRSSVLVRSSGGKGQRLAAWIEAWISN